MRNRDITLTSERFGGVHEGVGYGVTTFRDEANKNPTAAILLKGGLGDIRSSSLGTLAKKSVAESDGELIAAIIRTERSLCPVESVKGAVKAREQRASSTGGAVLGFLAEYPDVEELLVAGQSQGGVSAIDGALKVVERDEDLAEILQVLTIDTPAIDGPVDTSIGPGLVKLGLHCVPDVFRMGYRQRTRLLWDTVKRGYSPYEAMFLVGEVTYLSTLDMRPEINEMDELGIDYSHVSHSLDIVPGAEFPNPKRTVFEGGHLHTLYGKGADEMAGHIVSLFGHSSSREPILRAA